MAEARAAAADSRGRRDADAPGRKRRHRRAAEALRARLVTAPAPTRSRCSSTSFLDLPGWLAADQKVGSSAFDYFEELKTELAAIKAEAEKAAK